MCSLLFKIFYLKETWTKVIYKVMSIIILFYFLLFCLAKNGTQGLEHAGQVLCYCAVSQAPLWFSCKGFCLSQDLCIPDWPCIYYVVENFWSSSFHSYWSSRHAPLPLVCVVLRIESRAAGIQAGAHPAEPHPQFSGLFSEESDCRPLRDSKAVNQGALESQTATSYFPWCRLHSNPGHGLF